VTYDFSSVMLHSLLDIIRLDKDIDHKCIWHHLALTNFMVLLQRVYGFQRFQRLHENKVLGNAYKLYSIVLLLSVTYNILEVLAI
jgi:hypothetical protein